MLAEEVIAEIMDQVNRYWRCFVLKRASLSRWASQQRLAIVAVNAPHTLEKYWMAVRLFVGNLPYDVTEAELREHFAVVGPLSYISLPTDRETGRPRGFAFVEFSERADAEEAIRRLNNQEFKGRQLAVNEARARDDRPPSGPSRPPSGPSRPLSSSSRPSAPRPSFSAETTVGDGRNFGPDALPRRRRKAPKGTTKFERGPKRPVRRRATGPVRFDDEDDDFDDDVSQEHFTSQLEDAVDQDTE